MRAARSCVCVCSARRLLRRQVISCPGERRARTQTAGPTPPVRRRAAFRRRSPRRRRHRRRCYAGEETVLHYVGRWHTGCPTPGTRISFLLRVFVRNPMRVSINSSKESAIMTIMILMTVTAHERSALSKTNFKKNFRDTLDKTGGEHFTAKPARRPPPNQTQNHITT